MTTHPYGLTRKQAACLRVIQDYVQQHGRPPSFEEIREAMGLRSKSGSHRLINALVERGHIQRLPGQSRSITLVHPDQRRVDACVVACAGVATEELERLGLGGVAQLMAERGRTAA